MFGDSYATLSQLKSYLGKQLDTRDEQLIDALSAASREIDLHCNRQFNRDTSTTPVATSRDFVPKAQLESRVDEFYSTTGLVVQLDNGGVGAFETTLPSSNYELFPTNGVVDGQPGWPYDRIAATGGMWFPPYWFGRRRASLRITALWGWASVPPPVKQSCLIMAGQMAMLATAPFGVAGMGEFGVVRVRDIPKAGALLSPLVRDPVKVG